MGESKARRDDTMTGPITAAPGTPDYQRQFERQALGAADSILRLWFVRLACGLYAILFLTQVVEAFGESETWIDWIVSFYSSICLILIGIECVRVALFGRSFMIRYLLSGAKRRT